MNYSQQLLRLLQSLSLYPFRSGEVFGGAQQTEKLRLHPYEAPYFNGIPIGELNRWLLYDSMAQYGGIFLHTVCGNGIGVQTYNLDTRLVDPSTNRLVGDVLDAQGNVDVKQVSGYLRRIEGRREDALVKINSERDAAHNAARFQRLINLGFRYHVGENEYILFPHLVKPITEQDVKALSGLEMRVANRTNGDIQVEIRESSQVRLIKDGTANIKVDNRYGTTVSGRCDYGMTLNRRCEGPTPKDVRESGSRKFIVKQDDHIVIEPLNQSRLLRYHTNGHGGGVNGTPQDTIAQGNSITFSSVFEVFPHPLPTSP